MDEFTPEELEQARVLFARPATFVMGCAKIEQLPDPDLPEIAFAGRSNVGKSSLINGLVGMHKLARASNEPGRTREVNFFDLDGRMRLVDLPGYGWAKASKATVKKFQDLSAPDPTTIWNLFGLIPWDPSTAPLVGGLLGGTFALSVLAIFYGLTMWLQMAMSPQAPDPMQRRIFQFMPIVFTFIMATFPAGLLIYWAWSNILTIFQQYVIMHRLKTENPIDTFLARFKKA